jgi:ATP-dependent RNA helicase DeaD
VVVESLAEEFDLLRIASAAVKMALEAGTGGTADEKEIPSVSVAEGRPASGKPSPPGKGAAPRASKGAPGERKAAPAWVSARKAPAGAMTRLFIGAGRMAGIGPGDLVGAITGEAGIKSKTLGSIEIGDGFSIVEVPKDRAEDIIAALRKTRIRGRKVTVNRDRKAPK